MRREAVAAAWRFERDRCLCKIADDGAGCGILSRAAPVEKRVADGFASNRDRVENTTDRSEHVRLRNQCRMHSQFDFTSPIRFDDCEELDAITELFAKTDICRGDLLDSLDEDLVGADPRA